MLKICLRELLSDSKNQVAIKQFFLVIFILGILRNARKELLQHCTKLRFPIVSCIKLLSSDPVAAYFFPFRYLFCVNEINVMFTIF